jgi:O-antigen/teichoic acid export membrane protein
VNVPRGERPGDAGGRSLARAVLGGTGMLAGAGAVTKLFGLVSSPILTRLAGPEPYGVVALAGTISSLATTVAMMGVDLSYARYFFDGGSARGEAVERFCWRFSLGTALAMSLLAGAVWWSWWDDASASLRGLATVVAAGTFVAVGIAMATTRQRVRGGYPRIAMATVAGGALGVALSILLAWRWRPDAWAMLVGTLVGSATTVAILGIPPAAALLVRSGLDGGQRRELLRMGFASAVTAPMFWVMSSADRWLLGAWAGQGPLGVYAFASGIGLTGMMVNSALTLAWFPEMSREYETSREDALGGIGRLWARLAGLLMVTWLIVAASGGDLIRLLADRRGGFFFTAWPALPTRGYSCGRIWRPRRPGGLRARRRTWQSMPCWSVASARWARLSRRALVLPSSLWE